MSVPFLDLGRLNGSVRAELDSAYASVVERSTFVGAGPVAEFERVFGKAHGLGPGAACASGTDALALALRALGVGPGHEVVVPAMTFVATAEAVVHVGAVPVLADVDPETLLLSPAAVDAVRTDRTTAVVPVHLYGHVVPFAAIEQWRASGLLVVEDAAQAHLGTWRGRTVGSASHAASFSFFPGKNLGALGDAGMVLSGDDAVVTEVRRLRDHGRSDKYRHDVIGWASRMDGLQAAFLEVKLAHLPDWTERRCEAAELYRRLLRGTSGVRLVDWEPGAVHHLVVVRLEAQLSRQNVMAELAGMGIGTGIHYPVPLSQQPAFRAWHRPCPSAEAAAAEIVSLPIDPLMSDADVATVCEALTTVTGHGPTGAAQPGLG